MKAQALLLENYEEVAEGEKLALPKPPKAKFVERSFYFNLNALTSAFLADDGNIKTQIAGMTVMLKYDGEIYARIINHLGT